SDGLGWGVRPAARREIDELTERPVRTRPDGDWQEHIGRSGCTTAPSLADVSAAGIYNCAVIIPGERSPYTQGLETELKSLTDVTEEKLKGTVLGRWMTAGIPAAVAGVPDCDPLIEVLPMNTEQRAA